MKTFQENHLAPKARVFLWSSVAFIALVYSIGLAASSIGLGTTIPDVQDQILTIPSRKTDAGTLVQEGRVLYELGKLDQAEAKLNQALKKDPGNIRAKYYLHVIREARYAEITRKRKQPVLPNPYARTNLIYISQGR